MGTIGQNRRYHGKCIRVFPFCKWSHICGVIFCNFLVTMLLKVETTPSFDSSLWKQVHRPDVAMFGRLPAWMGVVPSPICLSRFSISVVRDGLLLLAFKSSLRVLRWVNYLLRTMVSQRISVQLQPWREFWGNPLRLIGVSTPSTQKTNFKMSKRN